MQFENTVNPLVSIIMAAYNAERYIGNAIQSILNQTYPNIELLVINDGSSDSTEMIIRKFSDPRIKYFKEENQGVSTARNIGLTKMKGDFFCLMDADDIYPLNSLAARIEVFKKPDIDFVDGKVMKMNAEMTKIDLEWRPKFYGKPLKDLARLTGHSFFGPTWLIRRNRSTEYKFQDGLSHGEDLLFFMELARRGGAYTFVEEPILHYRNTAGSAMKNLHGLENGYRYIENQIGKWPELSASDITTFRQRWRKFMVLDYLKRGQIKEALGLIH